jgi:hypothetical protein
LQYQEFTSPQLTKSTVSPVFLSQLKCCLETVDSLQTFERESGKMRPALVSDMSQQILLPTEISPAARQPPPGRRQSRRTRNGDDSEPELEDEFQQSESTGVEWIAPPEVQQGNKDMSEWLGSQSRSNS